MKHLKHLCHSNKKTYLSCWQNQTMKKIILQLTGARREYFYTHIKSHWKTPLTPTQFPESHQAQPFPIGSLKVQFSHRNICQYWRKIIWCSVHTHLQSSHESEAALSLRTDTVLYTRPHKGSDVSVQILPSGSCNSRRGNRRRQASKLNSHCFRIWCQVYFFFCVFKTLSDEDLARRSWGEAGMLVRFDALQSTEPPIKKLLPVIHWHFHFSVLRSHNLGSVDTTLCTSVDYMA